MDGDLAHHVPQSAIQYQSPVEESLSPTVPLPVKCDADLIALCARAQATDARSTALMDVTDEMSPSDPRWSPMVDEARRIFAGCREDMNSAAKALAVTPDGLRAKASLALSEMSPTDFDDCPLVHSVLSQLAGESAANTRGLLDASALFPIGPDAKMIATCAAICDLERAYDAVTHASKSDLTKEDAAQSEMAKIVVQQDALVERLCELPCTTLAGVQAMATALAAWDRELLKDGPGDTGEIITSQMVERILALRAPTADADLLAVCAEFCASEAAFSAIYDDDLDATDEACAALANPIAYSWDGMLDRMAQMRATTVEGLAARALALAQHSGIKPDTSNYAFEFNPSDRRSVTGRLLHMLLTDALQMNCTPALSPDADLLALRPEFDRLHALMIDYNKDLIPDGGTECADFDALCRRIAAMPAATTTEGRAFQAAAAMHDLTYRMHAGEEGRDVVWLFLKGLAGPAFQPVGA